MIKNLVFDMGNVLIYWTGELMLDWMGVKETEERSNMLDKMFRSREWPLLDWGIIGEEEAEELFVSKLGEKYRPYVHRSLNWYDMIHPVPGMAAFIAKKKKEGYGIYLLSNAEAAVREYFHLIPGSEFFDGIMFSAEVKLIKPMPEIYDLLLEKYSLRADECLFIDDLPVNAAGALHEGMHSIVFRGDIEEIENYLNHPDREAINRYRDRGSSPKSSCR